MITAHQHHIMHYNACLCFGS